MDSLLNSARIAGSTDRKVFHRKIYYQCCEFIQQSNKNILSLTGPRRCGKTTCLKQLECTYNAAYYNIKKMSNNEISNLFRRLHNIENDIILIDEVNRVPALEEVLSELDSLISEYIAKGIEFKKKIILTGSQSLYIRNSVMSAFSTSACYIQTSFIDFEEWLLWSNKITEYGEEYTPIDEDFHDYVCNSNKFTKIENNLEYIQSCLDETIISELNSLQLLRGIVPASAVSADEVLSVMYAFLISLHNQWSVGKYQTKDRNLLNSLSFIIYDIDDKVIESRIKELPAYVLAGIPKDLQRIRNCIVLLQQFDLVTIVETTSNLDSTKLFDFIKNDVQTITTRDELFRCCNVCVKAPMFYFNMVKQLLPEVDDFENKIKNQLYGSAYECIMRCLLSYEYGTDYQMEYQDYIDGKNVEVDFVNVQTKTIIEFSVSGRHRKKNLELFDDSYNKILNHTDNDIDIDGVKYRNYLKFLLKYSRGYFIKQISPIYWQ